MSRRWGKAPSAAVRYWEASAGTRPAPVSALLRALGGVIRLEGRQLDFNREGLVHVGLLPEMIEDARRDAGDDEKLEPLFRSAEAYLRMWDKAERQGAALRAGPQPPPTVAHVARQPGGR